MVNIRWVVVSTFSGAEWCSFTIMLKRGIPAFYPRIIRSARRGRWPQAAFTAQFPGYIFAGIGNGVTLENVKSVLGVKGIVRNGPEVVLIPSSEIADWRKTWLKEYRAHVPRLHVFTSPVPGDRIAIPSGAFIGLPARILTIDKSGYVTAQLGNLEVTFHVSALPQTVRGDAKQWH